MICFGFFFKRFECKSYKSYKYGSRKIYCVLRNPASNIFRFRVTSPTGYLLLHYCRFVREIPAIHEVLNS